MKTQFNQIERINRFLTACQQPEQQYWLHELALVQPADHLRQTYDAFVKHQDDLAREVTCMELGSNRFKAARKRLTLRMRLLEQRIQARLRFHGDNSDMRQLLPRPRSRGIEALLVYWKQVLDLARVMAQHEDPIIPFDDQDLALRLLANRALQHFEAAREARDALQNALRTAYQVKKALLTEMGEQLAFIRNCMASRLVAGQPVWPIVNPLFFRTNPERCDAASPPMFCDADGTPSLNQFLLKNMRAPAEGDDLAEVLARRIILSMLHLPEPVATNDLSGVNHQPDSQPRTGTHSKPERGCNSGQGQPGTNISVICPQCNMEVTRNVC